MRFFALTTATADLPEVPDVAVFAGLSNVPRTRVFETRAMAILPGAAGVL